MKAVKLIVFSCDFSQPLFETETFRRW